MKLTIDAISGVLGIVPTPSTPDASHWATSNSVDFAETERMIRLLSNAGIGIFITCGSFAEGASLVEAEHRAFTRCVAETLAGRGLLFAGVTTLNTRDTITRGRAAMEAGADGLFLGRPMWLALDAVEIVRYYQDIAEALPGAPLIIYDNHLAFKGKISTETYQALSRNRSIVATKHIGGPAMAGDLRAVEGRMRVLPIDAQWPALAEEFPDQALACWTGNAADGPEPLIALQTAVMARDWPRARHIASRMSWAQSAMFPDGSLEKFMDYNIPIAHGRLEGSGLVKSGPPRPPYLHAPPDYIEGGRETGRRWRKLRGEFPAAS